MNDMIDEEVIKHKKRTASNVSKAKRKSDHSHQYIFCLFRVRESDPYLRPTAKYSTGSYCAICGKVGNVGLSEIVKIPEGGYRMLTQEELLSKYHNLPIITVDSVWDKYIPADVLQNVKIEN